MRKTFYLAVFLIPFHFTLKAQLRQERSIGHGATSDSLHIPADPGAHYFPLSMFNNSGERNKKVSRYLDMWYSRMLYGMQEPVLSNKTENGEVYRFTWLRLFRHPVCVRIEKHNEKVKLYLKVTDGTGGSYPGKLIINTSRELTPEQWNAFRTKITLIRFWKMPVEEVQQPENDNSEWILEGATKDSYHFVTRTSPSGYKMKNFRECCEYLIQLSEMKKDEL